MAEIVKRVLPLIENKSPKVEPMSEGILKTNCLDAEELLHIAIAESKADRHHDAISHLKQALEISPTNARAKYFLGAEYAQIGMYDRAIENIARSIDLDSGLNTARLQLGLLYISNGDVNSAQQTLAPLAVLPKTEPLLHFADGLRHLIKNEFQQCMDALKRGIELNHANPALNTDMQRILNKVKNPGLDPAMSIAPDLDSHTADSHILILQYANKSE